MDQVKPVVSSFDPFTIGSRGVNYEPLGPEQFALMRWSLSTSQAILEQNNNNTNTISSGNNSSTIHKSETERWTMRWMDRVRHNALNGVLPKLPQRLGDPTSHRLLDDVIKATSEIGAVRRNAECFNFFVPQASAALPNPPLHRLESASLPPD
ncbi:MAG: hypothetical protein SGPRY_011994 [Prymnesium sp.]